MERLEIFIPNGPRLGTQVIEAAHVAKSFGDKLLYDDLNFTLPQAGIVGVIGPNGAGKTTSFYMIVGLIQPNSGKIFLEDHQLITFLITCPATPGLSLLTSMLC